ncbi:histidinol-phosphatase [Nocardia sp. NPDC051030]|uniref:histidinol-phosphatase n=1 Tax=Nocardia sp. NPDC051030 TaxID=3155162 RepID=UPI003431D223
MTDYSADLALALTLADAADAITRDRFGALDLKINSKPDLTPVSDADLAVEQKIREILGEQRPQDLVLGEEFGGDAQFSGRQWVVDPIDGTKNFVRGVPVWASLISLLEDGVPVVGVVSAPALSRRWWAAAGSGAWTSFEKSEPKAIAVSEVAELGAASLAMSSLHGWRAIGRRDKFITLSDEVWRVRGYGDFFGYALLAEGAVDIVTEPELSLWDMAALDILIREAGGTFTSLDGKPGPHGGSAVATNSHLQDQVLAALAA